jgi:predicted kinase
MGPGTLLLLTGSPGCGKTTVAPLVADLAPRSVCLDTDWYFAKLRSSRTEPWEPEAHEQNRTVLSAAAAASATFASRGYFTVAEGILYPFMLDLFVDACGPLGIDLHYVVLRAPAATIHKRIRGRLHQPEHAGALADEQVVDDLWAKFEAAGIREQHRVDVGDRSPAVIAEEIFGGCLQGRYAL